MNLVGPWLDPLCLVLRISMILEIYMYLYISVMSYRGHDILHLVPGDDPVPVEVVHVEGPPQLVLLATLHQH